MAQTATKRDRHGGDGDQFPIHHEGGYLRVFTNPSGELFVEETRSGVQMRISSNRGAIEFTTDSRVEPIRVSNMIGWRIERR